MSHHQKFWKSEITEGQFNNALGCVEKRVYILFKQKACEVIFGPSNTVILKLLKSNMDLQFVTGVYAMLTYLTSSYLGKPEHTKSKLMKKGSKGTSGKDIKDKKLSIGNTFLTGGFYT